MSDGVIRYSRPEDQQQLLALYPLAFPDEDLLPLLQTLLEKGDVLSLVLEQNGALIGHVAFTPCSVASSQAKLSLLAPLAVHPDFQKRAFGKALIKEGAKRLAEQGFARVLTLGDPVYYGRSGFRTEVDIQPPHPLTPEWASAWQSLELRETGEMLAGQLMVPDPWQSPMWWSD